MRLIYFWESPAQISVQKKPQISDYTKNW
jgi:hypothetical protein